MTRRSTNRNLNLEDGTDQRSGFPLRFDQNMAILDDHTHVSSEITDLPAAYTNEQAQDAVGAALTDSATVDFTYDDTANTISAAVLDAPKINGVAVTGTPSSGQVPTATSGTAATWQTPAGSSESLTTFSNANATAGTTTQHLFQIGTMTAARTVTLPAASAVSAGHVIVIGDLSGTVTTSNTIIISRAGSDTINGATTEIIKAAYGQRRLVSDGTSKWTFDGGIERTSNKNVANGYAGLDSANHVPALKLGTGQHDSGAVLLGNGDFSPLTDTQFNVANVDGAVAVPSLRTLGFGSLQAARGSTVVPLAGGTMTGPLILSGDPTDSLGAVPLRYITIAVSTKSADYTLTNSDDVVLVTGTTTITLPDATTARAKSFTVKRTGTNNVTVATQASQTIDGASTVVLTTQYDSLDFISNGTNWFIT